MKLVCPNCGTVYRDPGGEPGAYRCASCGFYGLERRPDPATRKSDPLLATVLGALLGASVGGGAGVVIGGLLGFLAAKSSEEPTR